MLGTGKEQKPQVLQSSMIDYIRFKTYQNLFLHSPYMNLTLWHTFLVKTFIRAMDPVPSRLL